MTTTTPPGPARSAARLIPRLSTRWRKLDLRVRIVLGLVGIVLAWWLINIIFLTPHAGWSSRTVAATPPLCGTWQVTIGTLGGPDPLAEYRFGGIAAVGSNDVWAVGDSVTGDGQPDTPDENPLALLAHWDGSNWTRIEGGERANPEIYQLRTGTGGLYIELNAVLAQAKDDVWAVGESTKGSLVVHWDGQAWSMVPSANAGSSGYRTYIYDLAATAKDDLWAVGSSFDHHTPIILHSTGQAWESAFHYTTPATVTVELQGVTAVDKDTIWTVGYTGTTTLVMRPAGDDWKVVASPNRCAGHNTLRGVAGAAADDIWAVGGCKEDANTVIAPSQPLIEHWNGTAWSLVPAPAALDQLPDALLTDVAALAKDNVWAVGSYQGGALLLHWDGTAWTGSTLPNADPAQVFTAGHMAVVSLDEIWLVGATGAANKPPTAAIAARYTRAACAP